MKIKNPLTFSFEHPNFGGQTVDVSLNQAANVSAILTLDVDSINNLIGSAQLQFADNGNVVLRVHLNPTNPIHVLILDDSGILFEQ